ncbi:MAG: DNA-processing protein DprA [bacterium]|jgi:DNA processing protein|nr:DNA-processing protein DprA [bacterium]
MKKLDRDQLYPWLTLLRAKYMGSGRVRALEAHFGSVQRILKATPDEIAAVKGFSLDIGLSIQEAAQGKFDHEIDREITWCERKGVSILLDSDSEYPEALRHIPASPALLYAMGEIRLEDILAFAIVGTRHASDMGRRNTAKIACELAEAGLTIVSGLAWGIDGAAHMGALRCKKGRTIAVLGSGLKCIYPKEHIPLAEQISQRGAVLTELFTDVSPQAKNFPPRNRIISGLSLGVLIAEAPKQSGALITANYALEQGKEIFAIPGAVDNAEYVGTNNLIQESAAKLVTSAEEILRELEDKVAYFKGELDGKIPRIDFFPHARTASSPNARTPAPATPTPTPPPPKPVPALDGDEAAVFSLLGENPIHIDILCRDLNWPIARVSSALSMLELKGLVEREAGMRFCRGQ